MNKSDRNKPERAIHPTAPTLRVFSELPRERDSVERSPLQVVVMVEPMEPVADADVSPGPAYGGAVGPLRIADDGRVVDAFRTVVERMAEHAAVVTKGGWYRYADVMCGCRAIARFLLDDLHLCGGERVALMLDNGPEYLAAYYGILAAGAVLVPLPPTIEDLRWQRILQACNVRVVLTSSRIASRRGLAESGDRVAISLRDGSGSDARRGEPVRVDGQSLAMIMFTSGSSGEPKGVMLSDRNILSNAQSILDYLPITRRDRALALLPFYHAYGHSVMQTHLLAGATLVIDGMWTFPNSVVDALERHEATSLAAVPEGYHALLSYSDLGTRRLPQLKYMTVAGGALRPEHVTAVARRIAPADLYIMYGQTEATARLAYLPPTLVQVHPDSIGRPIPGVELAVLDDEGRPVAAGETGQLCARGPNVMLGYWNDAQATRATLRDGWLRTGDLATHDPTGLFYVRARANDLVKLQGYRVHPREVEDTVSRGFPDVRIIIVPYCHQRVNRLALFAIAATPDPKLIESIRQFCLHELPRHKVPSHLQLLPRAPLNASLKLDRAALVRMAEAA